MDIRKYFKNLEEKLETVNPALAFNCPEKTKIQMEPHTDLWQGGEKTTKFEKKFETKTFKRSRTSLSEEERDQNQDKGKKIREDEELIISQEEKMEIGKKRGEEGKKNVREKFHHTLMGGDKPDRKPGEPTMKFQDYLRRKTFKTPSSSQPTNH